MRDGEGFVKVTYKRQKSSMPLRYAEGGKSVEKSCQVTEDECLPFWQLDVWLLPVPH